MPCSSALVARPAQQRPPVSLLLQNVALSIADNEELCFCLKAWQELPRGIRSGQRPGKDDALKAMAVLDRIRRALAEVGCCGSVRCDTHVGVPPLGCAPLSAPALPVCQPVLTRCSTRDERSAPTRWGQRSAL